MRRSQPFFLLLLFSLLLASCLEDQRETVVPRNQLYSHFDQLSFNAAERAILDGTLDLGEVVFVQSVDIPLHMQGTIGTGLIDIPPNDLKKALLGRVLFYDTQLSATGEVSCASCHQQELAFSDDVAFSKGINGGVTKRNSIALASVPTFLPEVSGYGSTTDANVSQSGNVGFFWDERAATIKEQSILTIQDDIEMGRDLVSLAADLREQEVYRILSMKAFGTTELTPDRITLALEKFCATMTSMNSRFDTYMNAVVFPDGLPLTDRFSDAELLGHRLFDQNCSGCHGSTMAEPTVPAANNGLDLNSADRGVGALRGAAFDGVFKVPFLRNIALTAPYMHDGRFETLREVIDHYSEGIQSHRNLHPRLQLATGQARQMRFSEEEKEALIAFLEMTTDHQVLDDKRLADPFRR